MNNGRKAGFAVRPAAAADASVIFDLRRAFWSDQIAKGTLDSPDQGAERLLAETAKLTGRARTVLAVATQDKKIIGYLYGQVKMLPGAASSVGSVEEIFVAPAHRRGSVAQELVANAIAQLKALGAGRMQLRVLQDNAEGRTFWKKLGFAPSVTIYEYTDNTTPSGTE
ncbi:MAG TPA: GNAT family N-acetyltransferase [Rhizomicrobium sp.]